MAAGRDALCVCDRCVVTHLLLAAWPVSEKMEPVSLCGGVALVCFTLIKPSLKHNMLLVYSRGGDWCMVL